MNFNFPGWHMLDLDDPHDLGVGSWLLHHNGEAMLLELPPAYDYERCIAEALEATGSQLKYVTASHDHEDHWDSEWWEYLQQEFPKAEFLYPGCQATHSDMRLFLGGEPVWMLHGPKHSMNDVITIFKGVAMTGDVETGKLESCNEEVDNETRAKSMAFYKGFEARSGYRVHTQFSAHRNTLRTNVNFSGLFAV